MSEIRVHPKYNLKVSACGEVFGPRVKRKTRLDRYGYKRLNVLHEGTHITLLVHGLVADCFLERERPDHVVNHINGDKSDNSVENLEYVTVAGNNAHMRRVLATGPKCIPYGGFYSLREAERMLGVSRFELRKLVLQT